jgi:hypothetical protein
VPQWGFSEGIFLAWLPPAEVLEVLEVLREPSIGKHFALQ